ARTREYAAALGEHAAVIVLPAGARQGEQAFAFDEACLWIGCRVDEDVAVIEGSNEADRALAQHAIAEYVAGHVADAGDGERRRRYIHVHLAEVALDRFPGAARGNPHFLVVVAGRAAGGESVAEPESMLVRN